MEKTVAGTIQVKNRSAFFIRDVDGTLPLKLSYHEQLKYRFMDGDRITASLRADRRGRLQVLPVKIINRALSTIGGVISTESNDLFFIPFALPAIDRFRIDGQESENLNDGDAVIARIVRYPSYEQPGQVAVERILGKFRDPLVDDRLIIHRYQLPRRFPRGSRQLAKGLAVPVCKADLKKRTDFRHQQFITIDGDTARDFDDAVAVDQLNDGGFRLYVSIADVSHYVKPGSILDQEASRFFTVIFRMGHFPAQKNMFLFFPETYRAHLPHPPFTDHFSGQLGGSLNNTFQYPGSHGIGPSGLTVNDRGTEIFLDSTSGIIKFHHRRNRQSILSRLQAADTV